MADMTCISLVVAMDERGLIGRNGQLPWRLPEDLKHFRRLTLGKTILMGRKTFESLGRLLDQRQHWVLSRDPAFQAPGCRVFGNLSEALAAQNDGELVVIGGAELYRQALPRVQRMHVTRVHAKLEGDTWFPSYNAAEFRETECSEHPADARHAYAYCFMTLERV